MAKGYDANRERKAAVESYGKLLGKRSGFKCEWCGGKDELRPWDYRPDDDEPAPENLALLCSGCRTLAGGRSGDPSRLNDLRNALWSDIPAVAEGAAQVLADSRVAWARDAIDESLIPDEVKEKILARLQGR